MRTSLLVLAVASFGCGSVVDKGQHDASMQGSDGSTTDTMRSIDAAVGPTPKLWWKLDGDGTNSGSVTGFTLNTPAGISYITGKSGMAASFGSGQYANVTGMRNTLGTYGAVTIAFWLKEPGTLSSASVLDDINRGTAPYGGIQLGFATNTSSLCVATTSSSLLSGGCAGPNAPTANAFHHWIIRYNGFGTGAGQGGVTEIYVDDVLAHTRPNDASNNPVFSPAIPDTLTLGNSGVAMDDLRIYDRIFTPAEQCTFIIGGTYAGTTCTLP